MSDATEDPTASGTITLVFPIRTGENSKCNDPHSGDNPGKDKFGTLAGYITRPCAKPTNATDYKIEVAILSDRDWGWMTISKTFNEQNLNWIHDQVNERIPANFYSQALEAAPSRACQKCKPVQIAGQPAQPYVVVNLQVADVDRVEKTWQFQAIAERRFSHSLQAIYGPSATADDMEAVREFWRDHHHALDRSWYCVLTDRALLMVSSTNDLDHTSNDLPTYAQQAVDFIWAQTALLNEIDQDLDKLLKDELPRLMQISSTSAQKRAEDLGHFLTPLVEHRKRYLSTLFDPLLYAFPAGTTHSVAKAAREFFMTVEARERVLHKFEAVDRHVDDTLQLGALNLSKT